ncbi:MAG: hypothetical protein ACYC1M_17740 [Armatimonadota bacterium]
MNKARLFAALSAVLLLAAASHAATWDVTSDFSISNGNPNGAWSYGWASLDFSSFTLYTNSGNVLWGERPAWYGWNGDRTPYVFKNTAETAYGVPTGWISIHPGNGKEPSIARWTAPAGVSGPVNVVGEFLPGNGGWMQIAVRKNNSEIWHAENAGTFDLDTTIAPGDTIDFAVYGGYESGDTPVAATITLPDAYDLTCTLSAPGISADKIAGRSIELILKSNGSVYSSETATLDANAQFHFHNLPAGTYELYAKSTHWVRTKSEVQLSSNTSTTITPANGDADGDNQVNLFDFVVLDINFDKVNVMADLDCDGQVNLFDYVVIDQNFGAAGVAL